MVYLAATVGILMGWYYVKSLCNYEGRGIWYYVKRTNHRRLECKLNSKCTNTYSLDSYIICVKIVP